MYVVTAWNRISHYFEAKILTTSSRLSTKTSRPLMTNASKTHGPAALYIAVVAINLSDVIL